MVLSTVAAALPADSSSPHDHKQQPTTHQQPLQLSFPLPHAPNTRVQLHLTIHPHALLLFLTTTTPEHDHGATAPIGSFVYAMPSRADTPTAQPLSTPLYPQTPTLDLATRLARILAKRTGRPTYVGNSTSFASAGAGGDVGEEMEGLRRVIEVVVGEVGRRDGVKAGGA